MKKKFCGLLCLIAGICMALTAFAGCGGGGGDNKNKVPAREEKTLLIGDSLFDLWKPTFEQDLAGAKNLKNLAIGGTTSVYWNKQQKLIQREMPTTVLLCLGTNDIADMGRTGEATARGDSEREQCLQSVLEMIKETVPDVHIYCLTVNVCGENNRWSKKDEIIICNQFMREYCADKDWVEMVETEYAFYDQLEDFSLKPSAHYFVNDYLHFSEAGYRVLTKIVRQAMGLDKKTDAPETSKEYKMEKVVFMGDSLFDFWDNVYRDFSEIKGLYDIAIGGTTAEYWTEKWQRTVDLQPKTVVICVGTNDIALGKNGVQAAQGIQAMLELYHGKLPQTKFYLCTVNICGEPTRWNKREDIARCNTLNREYCAEKEWVDIIETERAWYDDENYDKKPPRKYFWDDHLHFNDAGYEIFAKLIRDAIGLND